jgi:hypothetical protein
MRARTMRRVGGDELWGPEGRYIAVVRRYYYYVWEERHPVTDGTSVLVITVPNRYRFDIEFEDDELVVNMTEIYGFAEVVIEFEDCAIELVGDAGLRR